MNFTRLLVSIEADKFKLLVTFETIWEQFYGKKYTLYITRSTFSAIQPAIEYRI